MNIQYIIFTGIRALKGKKMKNKNTKTFTAKFALNTK